MIAITLLLTGSFCFALILNFVIDTLGILGVLLEVFCVFVLLAQKSLFDHVYAVAQTIEEQGLLAGRQAVSMIVGRDTAALSRTQIARAAIESLAENFSDGVVAPAFWYLVFGLPGLIVYKMINTADSMIAYRNARYLWFGRLAAQIDDLANWLPARISFGLIVLACWLKKGRAAAHQSFKIGLRDQGLHRSPNAGWPEAAMAGAAGLALGGPRVYGKETVPQAWLNGAGKPKLSSADINDCLSLFCHSCCSLWAIVFALLVLV